MSPSRAVEACVRVLRGAAPLAIVLLCAWTGRPSAQSVSAVALLDRYAAGEFDGVVAELTLLTNTEQAFTDILRQLKRDGPAWLASGNPVDRERRALAAATFALEAARVDEWHEWKWLQRAPGGVTCDILYWQAPPQLIVWGQSLFDAERPPSSLERFWTLAALAVAERSEDFEFLVGRLDTDVCNPRDEVEFATRTRKRFPDERRLDLAMGIGAEFQSPEEAREVFEDLREHIDVGGEALMRLGAVILRERKYGEAIPHFERAEAATRDPYVIYLARYFKGLALERWLRLSEAEHAYRGALDTVPHAQSASSALSALLFRRGKRVEAQQVANDWMLQRPPVSDPWREYVHADDRFWPLLIDRLRAGIRR